ncbi:response regulator [Pedobacter panaciterrae]|jgi:DNA-binding NarL/FixJ family response regulator|uniref:Response regulator transcription factor n=1 Tax=Pedobacter panaciterrae TaxID=363849 RepID=A0ABU8NLM8_9SPHI|nr:response regulator transcription factor [uncultured Pedobacter sp.]
MSQHKNTIVIVDDHPIVIEGLIRLLSKKPEYEIIGGFTRGEEFISFLKIATVKIVLLDIMLPDINGMDLCKTIKTISPDTVVLAFSNYQERSVILQMLANGASGYLLKESSIEEIVICINEALNGQITFSNIVKEIISRPQLKESQDFAKLTVREKEILKLIADGKTTNDIAEMLFLSKFTVENHRKNLLQKLKAKNVADLIRHATLQNLI